MNVIYEVVLEEAVCFTVKKNCRKNRVTMLVEWETGGRDIMVIDMKERVICVIDKFIMETTFTGDYMGWLNWFYDNKKMRINLKEEN